jgi:DNA-directed RNA polymerase subunit RPC12/RpoP
MSRLVARILLSILMFPLAAMFFGFSVAAMEQLLHGWGPGAVNREATEFLAAGILTWLAVAIYWCLLWKSSVRWETWRVAGTAIASAGAFIVGACAGVAGVAIMPGRPDPTFGTFVGSGVTILVWIAATIFVWRETTAERKARMKASSKSAITCPTCGYNLTGLSEARCPECGSRFTLDELIALQPDADGGIE